MVIKHIIVGVLLAISLNSSSQTLSFNNTSNNWEEILKEAQKIDKPIFVDVYTEWCGPCKWMDQNVFNQKSVISFFETNFLSVKIDAEKGYGPSFAKENLVGGYPTYLFFAPNGELILSGLGSIKSELLIQSGRKALENLKKGISLQQLSANSADWNLTPSKTKEYIDKLGMVKKPTGVLIEYYLNAISEDSLYTPEVFKMLIFGKFTRFPIDKKVFQVLLYHYKKYPIKSGDIVSAWNIIRNNLKNFADSAGVQKDYAWLDEILKASDSLNDDIKGRSRERVYFQNLFYSGARDSLNFIKTAKEFGENFIINIKEDELYKRDSILYDNLTLVKFGTKIDEKTRQSKEFKFHKEGYKPESEIILMEILDIHYYLKYRFPKIFESNERVFKEYIKKALSLYQRNPVMVRQPYIDYVNKSILNIHKM